MQNNNKGAMKEPPETTGTTNEQRGIRKETTRNSKGTLKEQRRESKGTTKKQRGTIGTKT